VVDRCHQVGGREEVLHVQHGGSIKEDLHIWR
jgi:hypothetical protein